MSSQAAGDRLGETLIQRQTITAQVIDHILGIIKQGRVKPAERLPTEKQLIVAWRKPDLRARGLQIP